MNSLEPHLMEEVISVHQTSEDIQKIYNKYVNLPQSYFEKHAVLGPCPIKQWNYSWNGRDFPRTWCVKDFIEWTSNYNLRNVKTLGYTSTNDPELEFINAERYIHLNYPPYDLHVRSPEFDNTFDFFIFNQTIEHLYDPFTAVKNIYSMMNHGGYVFTSVPTINIPHMTPIHFNGYNPMGLAMLFKTSGFEIVEIGQWGNYDYISKLFRTHSWPSYETLQVNGHISNERENVCQCWILAKKPINHLNVSR